METKVVKDFLAETPQFQGIFNQLEQAVYEPQVPAWFNARTELKGFLEKAFKQVLTPKEALDQAAAKFTELIAAEEVQK